MKATKHLKSKKGTRSTCVGSRLRRGAQRMQAETGVLIDYQSTASIVAKLLNLVHKKHKTNSGYCLSKLVANPRDKSVDNISKGGVRFKSCHQVVTDFW